MAETNRTDMTEHTRVTPLTSSAVKPRADVRWPPDFVGPVVPHPDIPAIPAGAIPPGGPAKSMGDIIAEREFDRDRTYPARTPIGS